MIRLLFNIFCVVLTIQFIWLLLTHALRCYELGKPFHWRKGFATREGLGHLIQGFCKETAALMLLTLLWPLPRSRNKRERDPSGGPPVVLIPGYGLHRNGMLPLAWWLRRKGWQPVVASGAGRGSFASSSIEDLARQLADTLHCVQEAFDVSGVPIVAQGFGGIVARYYIEKLDKGDQVTQLITLGTAHHGTGLAVFATGAFSSNAPGSDLMAALEESLTAALPHEAPYTSISAEIDACVLPATSSELPPPAEHIEIRGTGHHGLVFSGEAFRRTRELLGKASMLRLTQTEEPKEWVKDEEVRELEDASKFRELKGLSGESREPEGNSEESRETNNHSIDMAELGPKIDAPR